MKKNDRLDSRSVRSNSSQSKSMAIATILVMIGLILSKSTGFLSDHLEHYGVFHHAHAQGCLGIANNSAIA